MREVPTVSYLGPAGSFTHAGARELFGLDARYTDTTTIEAVFDAVRRADTAFGVVPIENSTEGSVTSAMDSLIEGGVFIRREIVLDIDHCFMSIAGTLDEVERVYSHPQALAQCRLWLAKTLPGARLVPTSSTSAAARDAAGDVRAGAIGSRLAAELNTLPVLYDSVNDIPDNATRFAMLATDDAPRTGNDKTSVVFAVHDGRGALRRVLGVFDDAGINLTRIESRPSRQKAWDYVFLADLDGHREDNNVAFVMRTLATVCPMVRHLGSYPRHARRTRRDQ